MDGRLSKLARFSGRGMSEGGGGFDAIFFRVKNRRKGLSSLGAGTDSSLFAPTAFLCNLRAEFPSLPNSVGGRFASVLCCAFVWRGCRSLWLPTLSSILFIIIVVCLCPFYCLPSKKKMSGLLSENGDMASTMRDVGFLLQTMSCVSRTWTKNGRAQYRPRTRSLLEQCKQVRKVRLLAKLVVTWFSQESSCQAKLLSTLRTPNQRILFTAESNPKKEQPCWPHSAQRFAW